MGWDFVNSAKEWQGLSPSLTRSLLQLAGSLQNPDDQAEVRFSILARKGTCEGSPCDAVLEDFIHEEAVFWYVIEAGKQHDTPRSDGKVRHLIPSASAEGQATAGQW